MRKLPIILTLILVCAWGYTSWYWYVCNIKGMCDSYSQTSQKGENNSIITYDDVLSDEKEPTSETGSINILSGAISSSPKLSSEDVLSETVIRSEPTVEVSVSDTGTGTNDATSDTTTSTGATDTKKVGSGATLSDRAQVQETSLCKNPLIGPIGLGANNSKDEVERLEAFLAARGEEVVLNGIYEQGEFEAVKRFQEEYRTDILDPWDIVEPTGYVYRTTVKKINEIACQ